MMSAGIEPTEPKRVRSFALFFKNYMSISTLIVAALPVPVTSLGLIPTFAAQTKLFSVYTSLFCFLLVGFIFYIRHSLARKMFPEYFDPGIDTGPDPGLMARLWRFLRRVQPWLVNMLPVFFITCSLILVFQYNDVLQREVNTVRLYTTTVRQYGKARVSKIGSEGAFTIVDEGIQPVSPPSYTEDEYPVTFKGIVTWTDLNDIPFGSRLLLIYIGIFLTAEAAFVLMAIKEYLQDLLGLTDVDLIDLRRTFNSP